MLRNIKSRLYGSALPFIAADRVKVRMQEPGPQKGFRASLVQNFLRARNPASALSQCLPQQKIDGRSAASHSAVFSLFTDIFSTHTFQERLSCPKMLNDGYNSVRKRDRSGNSLCAQMPNISFVALCYQVSSSSDSEARARESTIRLYSAADTEKISISGTSSSIFTSP